MVAQIAVRNLETVHGSELCDQDLGQFYPIDLIKVLRITIDELIEPVVACRKLAQLRKFLSDGLQGWVSDRAQTTLDQLMIPLPQIDQDISLS
ncbi:hypothetical protein D3C78_1444180 [compost metagenome]